MVHATVDLGSCELEPHVGCENYVKITSFKNGGG